MSGRKRDRAVALQYDREAMEAPTVVARGEGLVARKIVERALEAEIPSLFGEFAALDRGFNTEAIQSGRVWWRGRLDIGQR